MEIFGIIRFKNLNFKVKILNQSITHDCEAFYDNNSYLFTKDVFVKELYNSLDKDNKLILVGDIYSKFHASKSELSGKESFKDIIKNYWGNYFIIQIDSNSINLMLSPANSNIQIFYIKLDEVFIFTNSIQKLIELYREHLSVDFDYLTAHLKSYNLFHYKNTILKNVFELRNGNSIHIGENLKIFSQSNWDFKSVSNNKQDENFEHILELLNNFYKTIIDKSKETILLFSGGLDSTLLARTLLNWNKISKFKLLNVFSDQITLADERIYCQEFSSRYDLELITLESSQFLPFAPIDINKCSFNKPPTRINKLILSVYLSNTLLKDKNCQYLTGDGGDNCFMSPVKIESLLEIKQLFFNNSFIKKLLDISHLNKLSILSLIGYLFKVKINQILSKDINNSLQHIQQGIPKKIIGFNHDVSVNEIDKKFIKNALYEKSKLSFCKQLIFDDIDKLLFTQQSDYIQSLNFIHPLLNQQIIEYALSLSIPKLFNHKYDRIPVRFLLSNKFNEKLAWRETKGDISDNFVHGLIQHHKFLIDFCTNGYLKRHGLLNSDKFKNTVMNNLIKPSRYQIRQIELIYLLEIFFVQRCFL